MDIGLEKGLRYSPALNENVKATVQYSEGINTSLSVETSRRLLTLVLKVEIKILKDLFILYNIKN